MFVDKIIGKISEEYDAGENFIDKIFFNTIKASPHFVLPDFGDIIKQFNINADNCPQPFAGQWANKLPYDKMWFEFPCSKDKFTMGGLVQMLDETSFHFLLFVKPETNIKSTFTSSFIVKVGCDFSDEILENEDLLLSKGFLLLATNIIFSEKIIDLEYSKNTFINNNFSIKEINKLDDYDYCSIQFNDLLNAGIDIETDHRIKEMLKDGYIDKKKQMICASKEIILDMYGIAIIPLVELNLVTELFKCKNVKTVEVKPDEKIQKKRKKNGKEGLFSYHVLQIKMPGAKQIPHPSYGEPCYQNSIHWCRGSVATYTEEKKLFGKWVGSYWRRPHIKGQNKKHVVLKDYDCQLQTTKGVD